MTVDEAIEDLNEKISDVADDTSRWSQADSAEIYEAVAEECRSRAELIRQEMSEG